MSILLRIKEEYPKLSNTQKKIADYVTSNPETVCFLPIRNLAKEVGASEVTIIKFVKNIGSESYADFKKELQSQLQHWISPDEKIGQALKSETEKGQVLQEVMGAELRSLKWTYANNPAEVLERAVDLLSAAKKIYVVGYEISENVARFCVNRLYQLGRNVEFLDVSQDQSVLNCLVNADSDTIFLVIGFPIYSSCTLKLVDYLCKEKRRYIAVSDRHLSQIAVGAEVSLVCSNEDTIFYNTLTSAISLVNILCSMLAVSDKQSFIAYQSSVKAVKAVMDRGVREE